MNKFKVGDKVKYKNNLHIITFISDKICVLDNKMPCIPLSELTLAYKTIRDVEVGDVIVKNNNSICKERVLGICGEMIALSCCDIVSFNGWFTISYIEKYYSPYNQESTITIEGKTYNKSDVESRLSELKPIA